MNAFDSTSGWFWKHIVGRLLLGTLPGSDLFYHSDQLRTVIGDRDNLVAALAPSNQLAVLSLPDIWIGAAVGVVFIIVAIRLRRRAGEI
jgi:ABC-2 type transport system permease protein